MELKHIGRYDIKSLIGQGGMSTVYLGYDPRSQREVAIKVLPPYYLHSTKFRERFEREALMIALLEHPAIVPVYDMGEEDGQPYIVMRYMSGGSLGDKLKKGPIPLRDCMEMYLRLAPALDTAHARGVVHRDVKPDNLLFDKYDNVFLSDFGLARLRETIGFANISDGSVMGTPAYMSPEQIQGEREIDGRSDIYSMGVVLYQMLSTAVPYNGATAASVMMMHLVNPVPQIRDQITSLPPGIQAVLDTAMAKKPEDRFQTAGEFAKAIQAVTTGVQRRPAVQSPPASAGHRSKASVIPTATPPPGSLSSNGVPAAVSKANGTAASTPAPSVTPSGIQKPSSPPGGNTKAGSNSRPNPPSNRPAVGSKHRYNMPVWAWVLGVTLVILLTLVLVLWAQGVLSFPFFGASTLSASTTEVKNTPLPVPGQTVTTSSHSPGSLGQADKLAFVKSSDIWASNMDGTDLVQLTSDAEQKANLHWTPDGQSVIYTSGSCIKLVGLQTREVLTLTCFEGVPAINAFDLSPDGQQVALGLDQTNLYLLPYALLFNLPQESQLGNVQALASCANFAPYKTGDVLKSVSWSLAENHLALLLSTLVDGIYRDQVNVLDFNQCTSEPPTLKAIFPTHFLFTLSGYFDHPEITSLSLNNRGELLLNGFLNGGFGSLQLYDLQQGNSQPLTPNGDCCYRDAHWSPDGSYLFYSYQSEPGGEVSLFYIPTTMLSEPPSALASLALPAGFLEGSLGSLQPALRAIH